MPRALPAMLLAALVIAATPTFAAIPNAYADDSNSVGASTDSFFASATSADQVHDSNPSTTSTAPAGHWEVRPQCTLGGSHTCAEVTTCPDGTPMQHLQYILTNGTITATSTRCPTTDEPPGPTPTDIYNAFKTIPLPTPQLHIQPTGDHTLVNLPTIYYTNPTTIDTTLTLLNTTLTFHITTTYTWHYDDHTPNTNDTATSNDPGAPYPHQTITHTYHHPGTAHPTVEATYHANYQIHTGNTTSPWQHLNQTITLTSPPHTLTIHTATPHLTGN
jgi:hypothetical protein